MSKEEQHPHVTGRESVFVLCNDLADNVPPQCPTEEYPYFMSFRSKTPICIVANMASITPEFYQHVKGFPNNPDLQREFKEVFKDYFKTE